MTGALLETRRLAKRFGGVSAIDGLDLAVEAGELHAVIGPNGAGKTTLIAQLGGQLRPDAGRILLAGHDITALPVHRRTRLGIGRSFQISSVFPDFTALENVAFATQARLGHSFRLWRPARGDPELEGPAVGALEQVGLLARAEVPASTLSHGERRQLEIAMTLAIRPRILLLDEPLAGMGLDESSRVLKLLRDLRGKYTILFVEHDMSAVFALADRITVLVSGRAVATGTADEIRGNAEVQRAYLGEG